MHIPGNQLCFKKSGFQPGLLPEPVDTDELEKKENKKLYCKYCKQHITDTDQAISIQGAHTHTFTNPAGFVYTINCYQSATGCVVFAERTDEYSWFAGFKWQLALCNSCQEQLGWLFSNTEQFYALIDNRLVQTR